MFEKENIVNIYNEHNYEIENFAFFAKTIFLKLGTKLHQNMPWCIAVILIDELTSQTLNKQYRKKDYIPDVLSFANDNNDFPQLEVATKDLGDIYICFPKALLQAKTFKHTLLRELSFLFLHGLLHTLGYDHETVAEEKIMFRLQDEILNEVKYY